MKKRLPTAEEKKLWKLVTRHDKKLHPNDSEEEGEESAAPQEASFKLPAKTLVAANRERNRLKSFKEGDKELAKGAYADIDRNTAERFRKGDYPIDANLDLHGMTRDKAHGALVTFIESHYARGSRCLLVITGKGRGENMGVLREALPSWLQTPALRPMILAFDMAKQKHGGAGAYYILLKRKR